MHVGTHGGAAQGIGTSCVTSRGRKSRRASIGISNEMRHCSPVQCRARPGIDAAGWWGRWVGWRRLPELLPVLALPEYRPRLGIEGANSDETLRQPPSGASWQRSVSAAERQEPSYRARGVLTDGFDSTSKSLCTLFLRTRLGLLPAPRAPHAPESAQWRERTAYGVPGADPGPACDARNQRCPELRERRVFPHVGAICPSSP